MSRAGSGLGLVRLAQALLQLLDPGLQAIGQALCGAFRCLERSGLGAQGLQLLPLGTELLVLLSDLAFKQIAIPGVFVAFPLAQPFQLGDPLPGLRQRGPGPGTLCLQQRLGFLPRLLP